MAIFLETIWLPYRAFFVQKKGKLSAQILGKWMSLVKWFFVKKFKPSVKIYLLQPCQSLNDTPGFAFLQNIFIIVWNDKMDRRAAFFIKKDIKDFLG